jgi:hypothetical protein
MAAGRDSVSGLRHQASISAQVARITATTQGSDRMIRRSPFHSSVILEGDGPIAIGLCLAPCRAAWWTTSELR